ncbi:MAG: A24 family peptidase [Brevundimonas sp.]|uniref:prepilin peptidase n=1 Tax=Brevundimonas sp. TaxID=1871086 RepID=UPI002AB920E5|nr:A24 family peptidase [Brevundimonas sp.]MDZ4114098.1 A24 family peptidase [Brevundimonas sp.]
MLAAVGIGAGGLIVGLAVSRLSLWLAALDGEAARATSLKRDMALSLFGGGLGVWAALASPSLLIAAVSAVLAWQLLMLAVVDGENFWLPDVLTWPLVVTGLLAAWWLEPESLMARAIGAAAGFGLLWGLGWLYRRLRGREGLGGGDPFLMAGAGAWVGWMGLASVMLWAGVAGLSLVIARRVTGKAVSGQDALPFGVFLAIGIWLTWLYGPLGLAISGR